MKLFRTWQVATFVILLSFTLFSCSNDDDEGNKQMSLNEFKSNLCFGGKFTERTYNQLSLSEFNTNYSSLVKQTDYYFKEDGSCTIETIVTDFTERGYTKSSQTSQWTADDIQGITLRITPANQNALVLSNVSITNTQMTSDTKTFSKEIEMEKVLSKTEVKEYSIEGLQGFLKYDSYNRPRVVCTPITLSIKTDKGIIMKTTRGKTARLVGIPCFEKDGTIQAFDSKLYLEVYKDDVICDIFGFSNSEEPQFSDGHNYFYIGSFNGKDNTFTLIENGKSYQINN